MFGCATVRCTGRDDRANGFTGMADLKVSYDKLEESNGNLKSISHELDTTCDHQSDIKGSLGSGDIADGMHDFANNWNYHRHKLLDKVKAMQEMTEQTLEQFQKVDSKLSSSFDDHGKK